MHLPSLYKKTTTGAIQQWRIYVLENSDHSTGYDIWTEYGHVGGKMQRTVDSILEGKNIGKKNETSPKQQAEKEAKARWEKQKKKGYVETKEKAEAEEVDSLIEGGILPMLAHKYAEQAHKIKYPCYAQPKLDGIRCIAIIKDGNCTLWSRTRKPITAVPHINQELEAAFPTGTMIFDGELYNHAYRDNFEKIVSLVRQEEPDPEHTLVQYHIYDMAISDMTFEDRFIKLKEIFDLYEGAFSSLFLVSTVSVWSEDRVTELFIEVRNMGFEGLMLRNEDSEYVNKRSYDLQKVKEFDDGEFKIIGITEGRGKLAGHAIFVCIDDKGEEFEAKLKGETSYLKELFDNHDLWKGKKLTVQYQGLTGAKKVPRFPVGIAIRDYE